MSGGGFVSRSFVAFWLGASVLSCGAAADQPEDSAVGGASANANGGFAGSINPLAAARCRAPAGVSGSPRTIEEAVALLNDLPKPTTVACFVESLDRPLTVFASSSIFSAQPALSAKSPRVFIKIDRLWLSVVIDGESSYLLELSHLQADDVRSIKGEVKTPLAEALAPSAPYERVRYGSGTACGLCHYGEEQATSVSFTEAFASTAFRPRQETRVGVDALLRERQSCDFDAEPHRCGMLSAVFDGGPVVEEVFPGSMPTFY